MRYTVPIALAVLLALSLPISAVGTAGSVESAGSATAANNGESTFQFQSPSVTVRGDHAQLDGTPNRLVLEGDRRTVSATPMFDFGFAVASQDDSIRTDYRTYTFENSFDDIENDTKRTEAVIAELERVEDRIENLREREQEIVAAHADGEASEDEVLRVLARNYYEARELERALEDIEERVPEETEGLEEALAVFHDRDEGAVELKDTRRDFTSELAVYTSPIRTEIGSILRGDETERSIRTVSIESSQTGLVLSAVDSNEYLREATRYDNRDLDQIDQVETMATAQDLARDLYPWAFDTTSGISSTNHDLIKLYTVQATAHDHGQLLVYVDGGTGDIYHERQTLDLGSVPIETTDSMSGENVTATLERTPDTAPAAITVTKSDGQTPVDATIVVNGTEVGETDSNGELWFVPPTDGFEVTVKTDSQSLNASVASSR